MTTFNETPVTASTELNASQLACLLSYAKGEFSDLAECKSTADLHEQLKSRGDGLLTFLMHELDDQEDCNDFEEAIRRVRTSIEDLEKCGQCA